MNINNFIFLSILDWLENRPFLIMNNYLTCTLLYGALLKVFIYGAIFDADEFDLGSKTFTIDIGTLQERYLPLTTVDELASKNARILIELLRPMFATGIIPMPRLDPYRSKNLSTIIFNDHDLPLSGRVNIHDVIIIGAKTFHLNLLEIRMKNLRIDFILRIPVLKGAVSFEGNLHFGGFIPMNTQGRMRVNITGLSVIGAVQIKEKELSRRNFYTLQALHAEVHADDIKFQVLDTNLSGILQQIISSSNSYELPPNLYYIIEKVNDYITSEILKQGNAILKGLTIEEVKAYLLSDLSLPSH